MKSAIIDLSLVHLLRVRMYLEIIQFLLGYLYSGLAAPFLELNPGGKVVMRRR